MKFFYSLLLAMLPFSVFSQGYLPGRIVKTNGETFIGFVNYIDDEISPVYVLFKSTKDAGGQTYDAMQLTSFQADGKKRFVSYSGRISMDKNHFPDIAPSLDTTTAFHTLFLKEIYQGQRVSLLTQKDELKSRYFIVTPGQTPQELKFHYYYRGYNDDRKLATYKGQLVLLDQQFNKGENYMMRKIQETEFYGDELKSTVELIDKGKNEKNSYTSNFFIGTAMASSKFKFSGATDLNRVSTTVSIPKINLGFDFRRNSPDALLRFRLELEAWAVSPKFTYITPQGLNNVPTQVYYRYDQKTLAFTPQIQLNVFKHGNLHAYLGSGVSFTFPFYSNRYTNTEIVQQLYNFKTFVVGVPGEAGVNINNKFDVAVSYTTQLYSDYVYISMRANTLQLSFHYSIF